MDSTNARYSQQAGLEVVNQDTGLHPLPSHTPTPPPQEQQQQPPLPPQDHRLSKDGADVEYGGGKQSHGRGAGKYDGARKRRIVGLTVPVFWALVVTLVVVLAAGIGGGVGGGLSAQRTQHNTSSSGSDSSGSSSGSGSGTQTSTSAPSASSSSSSSDTLVPTDGCPGVHRAAYTPYSADGVAIPLTNGTAPQEFEEQCWTNWANTATATTHDILRTYTPTLENCITVCAEYNKAYLRNLAANTGAGGGLCLGVTVVKQHAGFCYLKNGTETNDTMGHPGMYSSAVLTTSVDDLLAAAAAEKV